MSRLKATVAHAVDGCVNILVWSDPVGADQRSCGSCQRVYDNNGGKGGRSEKKKKHERTCTISIRWDTGQGGYRGCRRTPNGASERRSTRLQEVLSRAGSDKRITDDPRIPVAHEANLPMTGDGAPSLIDCQRLILIHARTPCLE
ncbi:hypothetical protein J3R83DRAFT_3840 [Lanmaoa asiatica]|nr:hypothetical protein J3R83DRAFT_3840 [Lanmaoa asiatica]